MKWIETDEDVLQIRWKKHRGCAIDLIQANEFDKPCERALGTHKFSWSNKSEMYDAKFVKKIDGKVAIFNYGDDSVIDENKDEDLDIGVMKIFLSFKSSEITLCPGPLSLRQAQGTQVRAFRWLHYPKTISA